MRGLISTQYDDNECLVVYLLNYILTSSEQKSDKNYNWRLKTCKTTFLVLKTDYVRIEKQNNVFINVLGYENKATYRIYY